MNLKQIKPAASIRSCLWFGVVVRAQPHTVRGSVLHISIVYVNVDTDTLKHTQMLTCTHFTVRHAPTEPISTSTWKHVQFLIDLSVNTACNMSGQKWRNENRVKTQ